MTAGSGAQMQDQVMCEKCVELDGKIEHYRRVATTITDPGVRDGIKKQIERIKAERAALHPDQKH